MTDVLVPVPEGQTRLTNRDLLRMRAGFRELGNRKLALAADLKVARILRWLAPLVDPVDGTKRKAASEVLAAPDDTAEESPAVAARLRTLRAIDAQEAVDLQTVDVVLPMQWALREADMPKELTGEGGAKNAAGLGAIIADLGPLFVDG